MENLNNWIIVTNDFIWTYILIAPASNHPLLMDVLRPYWTLPRNRRIRQIPIIIKIIVYFSYDLLV